MQDQRFIQPRNYVRSTLRSTKLNTIKAKNEKNYVISTLNSTQKI